MYPKEKDTKCSKFQAMFTKWQGKMNTKGKKTDHSFLSFDQVPQAIWNHMEQIRVKL